MIKLEFDVTNACIDLSSRETPHPIYWIDGFDGRMIIFSGRTRLPRYPELYCSMFLFPMLPRGAADAKCAGFGHLFERDPSEKDQLFSFAIGVSEKVFEASCFMVCAPTKFQCEMEFTPELNRDTNVYNPKLVIGTQEYFVR